MLKGYERCPLCSHAIEEDDELDYKKEYERINKKHEGLAERVRGHTRLLIDLVSVSIGFIDSSEPEKAREILNDFSKSINKAVDKSKIDLSG